MEKTYIYSLSDPVTMETRYIGKTSYIKQRLYAHIKECKSNGKSHKISWIKSLLNKDLRPIIEIIDEVPISEWEYWECYWIEQFKSWGFNLVNLTKGGGGGNGYRHTNDSKEVMKHKKIGIPLSEPHKDKISEGVKEKIKLDPNYNKCYDKTHLIDKDLLYQKYITENLSMPKTAKFFNVSEKTIFTNLKNYNIIKDKSVWKQQCSSHPKKVILQYDLYGNLIKEHLGLDSIEFGPSGISKCCRGEMKSSHGFIWRYRDSWFDLGIDKLNHKYMNNKNRTKYIDHEPTSI